MLALQQQQQLCVARKQGSRMVLPMRLETCRQTASIRHTPFCQAKVVKTVLHVTQSPFKKDDRILCSASTQDVASSSTLPSLAPLDSSYEAASSFSSYANWIIPGRVMLGRYPYIEPSRCSKRKQGDQQMEEILKTGVDTFISLQAEIPAQKEMHLSGTRGFMPYKATAELIQASMEAPPPMEIVQGLRNPSIDKFLPTKRKAASKYHPKELQFVHSPIVDLGVPSADDLATMIKDIESRLAKGEVMYIHCWGGRGRAGTVGACLLASAYGIKAEEALERIQRSYNTRNDPERSKSPETEAQFAFVRKFIDKK